jgi:hypothetical protein
MVEIGRSAMRGNRILAAAALALFAAPLRAQLDTNPSAQVTSLLKKVFGR